MAATHTSSAQSRPRLSPGLGIGLIVALPALMTLSREIPPVILALATIALAVAAASVIGAPILLQRLGAFAGRLAASPAAGAMLAFLLLTAASILWSVSPGRGADHVFGLVAILALTGFLVACAMSLPRDGLEAMLRRALVLGLAAGAAALALGIATGNAPRIFLGLSGDLFRLNRTAVALVLMAPLALVLLWRAGMRAAALALALGCACAIAISESWSAKLATLVLLAAWPAVTLAPLLAHRLLTVGIVVTMLAMPFIVVHANALVPQAVHDYVGYVSLGARGDIWTEFALLVRERPFFGYGIESGHIIVQTPIAEGFDERRKMLLDVGHPHNAPLQIWFETGLAGILLAALTAGLVLRGMERLPRPLLPAATATVAAAYTIAVVSHGAWQGWWLALLAMLAGLFALAIHALARPGDDAGAARSGETGRVA